MFDFAPRTQLPTHAVENQPKPPSDVNLFASDPPLQAAFRTLSGGDSDEELLQWGKEIGRQEVFEWGRRANENPPKLRAFNRYGQRVDEVEFHPDYHAFFQLSKASGVHSRPWNETRPNGQLEHGALSYMLYQPEAGVGCPMTMTYAAVPALGCSESLSGLWSPRLLSNEYDGRSLPAEKKAGATCGMAMTEKQGGSDVRKNTTVAKPLGDLKQGQPFELRGHKWFCSAPMCDIFLTLAQTNKGLSCFVVPRFLEDGTRNPFHLQRLKDKLGNRSNASSEIEYDGTRGFLLGEAGRGIPTIIEMVHHTRLDCMFGSAGLMRQAVAQAIFHCRHRAAFGKQLIDQPLMIGVLADLAIEAEAALWFAMRMAQGFENSQADPTERALARIGTAVGKYWVTKRTPHMISEALECLGGAGYVEESPLPRLYREAPLNSIWEGSGNVMCLDVLRAIQREPDALAALMSQLESQHGQHQLYDARLQELKQSLRQQPMELAAGARQLVGQSARLMQAQLLLSHGDPRVAVAFCDTRLRAGGHGIFGEGFPLQHGKAILERALPENAYEGGLAPPGSAPPPCSRPIVNPALAQCPMPNAQPAIVQIATLAG